MIILYTPESVEAVLSSNTILEKKFEYRFLGPWFKSGLITSKGTKWRIRRKLLTPSFHFRILEDFLPIIDYHSLILVQNLRSKVGPQPINIVYWVTLYTLDILCETAMGKQIQAQKNINNPYLEALRKASEIFLSRISKPWLWYDTIFQLSSEGRTFKRCVDVMCNFSRKVICERKRELLSEVEGKSYKNDNVIRKKKAFLDLLLHHHLQDGSLTEEDVREEVDTFMFAGHDTTAVGLSWTLYLIGVYPDVQEKLKEEIDSIFGNDKGREVTIEDLRQLKYLECIIKESQRLYPSLPLIGREIREDVTINGFKIPGGTSCLVATYILHHNPDVYPNPEIFDPDRFLPENITGRHPYAYIPFSAGPRNCIGQRFAMMELKVAIAHVMRNFTIRSLDHRDKLHLTAEMVLRCSEGLRITLEER
ncbi:cytochrome P450 4c3-like [Centruroides sculpturatus]|uniref:cytochrome P450 4c3-like n=1 Tax=Centruroides sculpturatus TaxID=218467 RepID=UPI000C6DBAAB|nr:cytochrome P450 4c3-like [Centruroides sculpturatus]